MREFFISLKSVIILSVIFTLVLIGFNFYDIAYDKTYERSYYSSDVENLDLELININTASVEKLCTISYITADIAQNIVDYRQAHGDFKTIEDIQNVKGIGEKTFNNIRSMITVN